MLTGEVRLDHVKDSVQNFDGTHHGKRYVDAFKPWVYVAPWHVQGIVCFIRGIEIYPNESKPAGREE